ncbi:hypothetical protein [Streptomyces sp. NPDC098781]|uniref:CysS/YqeB C-terminal domain-containing protein n=1 Tax=Streptomyces sp. NPDC098781 TaxID=3366097 RepID=UPI0037FFD27C
MPAAASASVRRLPSTAAALPGLPEGADALMRARAAARERDGGADDSRELRGELLKLGVVVRDEGKRQYWRVPVGADALYDLALGVAVAAERMAPTVEEEGG